MRKITKYAFTNEENRFMEDFIDAVDQFCEEIKCCEECPIKDHCAYFFNDNDGSTFGNALAMVFNYFKTHEIKE